MSRSGSLQILRRADALRSGTVGADGDVPNLANHLHTAAADSPDQAARGHREESRVLLISVVREVNVRFIAGIDCEIVCKPSSPTRATGT